MTKKYELKQIEPAVFDAYVQKEHPEANFLQSSAWGDSYKLTGKKVFYLALYEAGQKEIVAATLAILKPAKRGRYLELPGGPLADWRVNNQPMLEALLSEIKTFAKAQSCVFVRMRLSIEDDENHRALLRQLGLREAPMHLHAEHTVMLDLTKSEDELLKDMRRQTRYEVRRAEKLGIELSCDDSKEAFEDFYELQRETAKRQGFVQYSRDFILAQQKAFGTKAKIYTAKLDGQILAQGLILMQSPEAVYDEAASTDAGRKYPGAYALQWRVIQDAKKAGLLRYNLFGIAPPNSPHHRYAGVTTFKTGFGGRQVAFLPAQDLVVKPMHYRLVKLLEEYRKRRRHLN